MIKKLLASVVVTFTFVGAVTGAVMGDVSSNEPPMIQFIKDHNVIETRQMNNDEFEAYQQLTKLEVQLEDIEAPIEALEEQMEAKAEKIEMAVEAMVASHLDMQGGGNFDYEHQTAIDELTGLVDQLKPSLKKVKAMAKKMVTAAEHFEQVLYGNYHQDDFDTIKILDGDERNSIHFGDYDADDDFDW